MKDRLYEMLAQYMNVIVEMEDIYRNNMLHLKCLRDCKDIKKEDVESIIAVNVKLLHLAIEENYKIHTEFDKIVIDCCTKNRS